jgi:hypothetical protein
MTTTSKETQKLRPEAIVRKGENFSEKLAKSLCRQTVKDRPTTNRVRPMLATPKRSDVKTLRNVLQGGTVFLRRRVQPSQETSRATSSINSR